MRFEPPTPDEVLAQYGKAMLEAQRFEMALLELAAHFLPESSAPPDPDDVARTIDRLFRSSAGRLAEAIKWPEGLEEDVAQAISTRNELAHTYLVEHERHLRRPAAGRPRARMLRNLRSIEQRFRDLDGRVEAESERVAAEKGWEDDPEVRRWAADFFRRAMEEEDRAMGDD